MVHIEYEKKEREYPIGVKGECSECHKMVGLYSNGNVFRHGLGQQYGGLCQGAYRKPVRII